MIEEEKPDIMSSVQTKTMEENEKLPPVLDTLSGLEVDLSREEAPIVGYQFQKKSEHAKIADARNDEGLKTYHPILEEQEGKRLKISEMLSQSVNGD